ncbi:hypothetical protein M529_21660 [Sphingobium ummariense RL-3]|uniref:Uncharacterized protein n=1 Tax=Sphingobium ummariense RL-3 TaxID=1346791 RepID=T0K9J7_9SPHN|nr:hypothetical protein M529_21660 [Sphingobium ummariense RL-3]
MESATPAILLFLRTDFLAARIADGRAIPRATVSTMATIPAMSKSVHKRYEASCQAEQDQ